MKLQSNKKKKATIIILIVLAVVLVGVLAGVLMDVLTPSEIKDPEKLIGVSLSSLPDKRYYFIGEDFDPVGASVQTVTNDESYSSFIDHTQLTFSGFDSTTVGEKVITVTYRGFTTSFKITVSERPSDTPYVTDIEISNFQDSYSKDFWNEYGPQVAGASIKLIYSDESTQEGIWLQSDWISGYEKVSSAGITTITIKYDTGAKIIEKVVTITITN